MLNLISTKVNFKRNESSKILNEFDNDVLLI